MPRKSNKIKEFLNMEQIIKEIKTYTKNFSEIIKYDGITIEFTCKDNIDRQIAKKDITKFCESNKLIMYVLEDNPENVQKFILQFPDMTPEYSDDEIQQMYIANFKWLLDDTLHNRPDLTKQFILDNTTKYVKLAVTTYYRSNVNQYKKSLDSYLTDTKYRQELNLLFMTYLDEYWAKKEV